jgi:hypothetical protein
MSKGFSANKLNLDKRNIIKFITKLTTISINIGYDDKYIEEGSWDSAVGIAPHYGLDDPEVGV